LNENSGFWFLLGGLLLILAGVFALLKIKIYNFHIADFICLFLVVVGVTLTILSLLKFTPNIKGFTVFLIGLIVFSSVGFGFSASPQTIKIYNFTNKDFQYVNEVNINCEVPAGNIYVLFVTKPDLICSLIFKQSSFFLPPGRVEFTNKSFGNQLNLNCYADIADVTIIVKPDLKGVIQLKTATGNVYCSLLNTTNLNVLTVETITGNVEVIVDMENLKENLTITARTITGNIDFKTFLNGKAGCSLKALTKTGNVETNLQDFLVQLQTLNHYQGKTRNYDKTSTRVNVVLTTITGNIKVVSIKK
jgi:hypothetical protein